MPPRTYPKLPATVEGPNGSVDVRLVDAVDTGPKDLGCWDFETRIIQIRRGMSGKSQWSTYYHEWMHMMLTDSGQANLFTHKQQEALCDAVAVARMRERFG